MRFILILFSCGLLATASCQPTDPPPPIREMRGAWMATVLNIDYPRIATPDPDTLRMQYIGRLDSLRALGINAVFVQVRSTADAFYPSRLAPWSRWLTGEQGLAPKDNFDPLPFLIQAAHQRGMEFHAWLNPYRVSINLDTAALSPDNIFYRHRDWVVQYGNRYYLDPGIPAAADHVIAVIDELLTNYPVDGLHFDDYFYPYRIAGQAFPDSLSYLVDSRGFASVDDWRRDNVNRFIQRVGRLVAERRPAVHFGVSPFGVWRNQALDPTGSATATGATSYDDLFADIRLWADRHWVDYVAPQIYFSTELSVARYTTILDWWTLNHYDLPIYSGMGFYKIGNNADSTWFQPDHIIHQLALNRMRPAIQGQIYYNTSSLLRNPLGASGLLKAAQRPPALWPARTLRPSTLAPTPRMRRAKFKSDRGVRLRWQYKRRVPENDLPWYFAIYRFEGNAPAYRDRPGSLLHVTPLGAGGRNHEYYDATAVEGKTYRYQVVPMNRYHLEGVLGEVVVD
ncbi:MAG: family 10 glycosylhydrolase [Saprospiraceae bacterium]